MAKTAKKVVLFIVEGPTDEDAFSSVMKKLHARQQVVFLVIHGDITADRDVNARNALTAVNQKIKELMRKYGLHRTDLLKIIHLVDMDGAYVPEAAIRYGDTDKLVYGLDEICAPKGNRIAERNRNKASVMNRLCTSHEIASVPYGLYYLSRNMEHVLFDDILRRAEKRGKELPEVLKAALERQAKVTFMGVHYVCRLPHCVWSPADYPIGWQKQN